MAKPTSAARNKVKGVRARSPEDKAIVRNQILRNAIELYREMGYSGFSMRKLAQRAGFSPAALYRYFDDKEAVFSGLVALGFQLMEKRLNAVEANNPKSYLMQFANAYFEFALSEPDLYKLMTTDHPPTTVSLSQTTTDTRWSIFASFGDRAESLGLPLLKSTVENTAATDALWAFGHGLASLAISLPYFDEDRMQSTLAFVFTQFEPFVDEFLATQQRKK